MPTSPNYTYAVGPGATVTDAYGTVYAINSYGQVTINGRVDATTNRVDALGYADGLVWQKNEHNLWYSKTSASARWVDRPASAGVPIPYQYSSPSNTVGSYLTDASLNQWSINAAGQVVVDNRIDLTTNRVLKLEYVNGRIWQENTDGNWYSKLRPSDAWSTATTKDPLDPTAELWRGGQGGNSAALGANWSQGRVPTPNQTLTMTGGTMSLGSGNLGGNTLLIAGERPGADGNYRAVAPVINMANGGSLKLTIAPSSSEAVKVNVTGGTAALNVVAPYPSSMDTVVTIAPSSTVMLNMNMVFSRLTETGGTVVLNGGSHVSGGSVFLGGNLAGNGSLTVGTAQSAVGALEVGGAIGAGVALAMVGNPARYGATGMVLDNPAGDKGTITLSDAFLKIKTGGIDSVDYRNSMLSLYHGSAKVTAIKVVAVKDGSSNPNDGVLSFGKDAAGNIYAYDTYASYLGTPVTAVPRHG